MKKNRRGLGQDTLEPRRDGQVNFPGPGVLFPTPVPPVDHQAARGHSRAGRAPEATSVTSHGLEDRKYVHGWQR